MLKNIFHRLSGKVALEQQIHQLQRDVQQLRTLQETTLILAAQSAILQQRQYTDAILQDIQLAEFKVFSQWGDDGIIQFLVNYLDIPYEQQIFIEFGVEDYSEANTRFLLINNNWKGLIMDGSTAHMHKVQNSPLYWRQELTAMPVFITKENINSLITQNGIRGEIGLLHIDIDGNDYWVWNEIDVVNPIIVIVEYNAIFGANHSWTVPYKADFVRTDAHHSNLYWGVSLAAIADLATEKGYTFVGCNRNGNNAYFVRNDKLKALQPRTVQDAFMPSRFREHRDKSGKLTFVSGDARLEVIKGLPIYNTRTQQIETI